MSNNIYGNAFHPIMTNQCLINLINVLLWYIIFLRRFNQVQKGLITFDIVLLLYDIDLTKDTCCGCGGVGRTGSSTCLTGEDKR